MSGQHRPVRIYSPLHNVSEHFVAQLTDALHKDGISCVRLASRNGEVAGDRVEKGRALSAHLRNSRRYARHAGQGPTLVAWPLLGWWEIPLWRSDSSQRTFVVVHDPEPLVKQNGLTPCSARLASRLTSGTSPDIVTLSPEAHTIVSTYFPQSRVHLMPHPMRAPEPTRDFTHRSRVLVLGQYKAARDLDVMAEIGPALRSAGWDPTVAGRGWPAIPGWTVVNRFLGEDEFDHQLRTSAAVLIPYRYYFQSGVALRALENGVPVVGRRTGFLTEILGSSFGGGVDDWTNPVSWGSAVDAAVAERGAQLQSATAFADNVGHRWAHLFTSRVEKPS